MANTHIPEMITHDNMLTEHNVKRKKKKNCSDSSVRVHVLTILLTCYWIVCKSLNEAKNCS